MDQHPLTSRSAVSVDDLLREIGRLQMENQMLRHLLDEVQRQLTAQANGIPAAQEVKP
jgi:regulator of replication initiation timing